jgi:hypothetical protein
MVSQMTRFKVVVNEKENSFFFESTSSTAEAKEACFECLKWLGNIEDEAKKLASASSEAQPSPEQTEAKAVEVSDV